jgi:hypothetical protein
MVLHLAADWLLQNDWMADHKCDLHHPAAWVHGGIHALALLLVFPAPAAIVLGVAHMIIDTRKPLTWWRMAFRQMNDSTVQSWTISVWNDQALHIALIALAAVWVAR